MAASKPRRTQKQRSEETRAVILEATIRCLVELGYTGTSTTAIQQRAGVSRGALTHHFATKQELMAAAVEYLTTARTRALEQAAHERPDGVDPVEWGIHIIWREAIEGDLFQAVIEVWNAARTDDDLHAALRVMEGELSRSLLAELHRVFGDEIASKPGFGRALDAVIVYARGAAVTNIMQRDRTRLIPCERESVFIFRALLEDPRASP